MTKELIEEALRWANGHPNRRSSELMRALAGALAAVPDAATERVTENSVRHVKQLTTELQNKRESLNDQRREFRKLLADARAERDAALAAVERVRAVAKDGVWRDTRTSGDWAWALDHMAHKVLAALDGAPEPEEKP